MILLLLRLSFVPSLKTFLKNIPFSSLNDHYSKLETKFPRLKAAIKKFFFTDYQKFFNYWYKINTTFGRC